MRNYRPYSGKRGTPRKWLRALVCLLLAGVLCYTLLLGAVLGGNRDSLRGDPRVMIVLGCRVMPWGPSTTLIDRLDKALSYLADHPNMTVVVSGGQGSDEPTTEARAMYDYLTTRGIPAEQILLEEHSFSTEENLRNSIHLLAEEGYDTTNDTLVLSSGLHLARVRMLWNRVSGGDYNLSLLAAPVSHTPSRIKMYVREPLALVKSFLLDR